MTIETICYEKVTYLIGCCGVDDNDDDDDDNDDDDDDNNDNDNDDDFLTISNFNTL